MGEAPRVLLGDWAGGVGSLGRLHGDHLPPERVGCEGASGGLGEIAVVPADGARGVVALVVGEAAEEEGGGAGLLRAGEARSLRREGALGEVGLAAVTTRVGEGGEIRERAAGEGAVDSGGVRVAQDGVVVAAGDERGPREVGDGGGADGVTGGAAVVVSAGVVVTMAFELGSGSAGSAFVAVVTAPSARTIRSSPWRTRAVRWSPP